jgi:hypothetical protein
MALTGILSLTTLEKTIKDICINYRSNYNNLLEVGSEENGRIYECKNFEPAKKNLTGCLNCINLKKSKKSIRRKPVEGGYSF